MTWPEFALSLQFLVGSVWLVGAVRSLAGQSASGVPTSLAARVGAAFEVVAALLLLCGRQTPWLAAAFTVRQLFRIGRAVGQRWMPSHGPHPLSVGVGHELALAAGGILLSTTPSVAGQSALPRTLDQISLLLPVELTLAGVLALAYLIDHTVCARHRLRAGWDFDARS